MNLTGWSKGLDVTADGEGIRTGCFTSLLYASQAATMVSAPTAVVAAGG